MEYKGRLFGKVGKSYIPLTNTTADFKMLENRVRELEAENLKLRQSEHLHKHGVMQAGSEKQPYFKLSTNEFGKHWLFYKPLKSEPGKYGCWMPIDDEFYSEFNKLQKAALGSGATVASEGSDKNA